MNAGQTIISSNKRRAAHNWGAFSYGVHKQTYSGRYILQLTSTRGTIALPEIYEFI